MSRMFGTVVRGVRAPIFREGDDVVKGTVETVLVKEGDEVKVNQPLMIVEAMKMENEIRAVTDGVVKEVFIEDNMKVGLNDRIMVIE